MKSKKELTTDENIMEEQKRFEKIFKNIKKDRKAINRELISNAVFMAVTLKTLQKQVKEDGPIITFVNGNGFETVSEHPAQKSYNTMINRYTAVIKQLTDLLDEKQKPESEDELMKFISQ